MFGVGSSDYSSVDTVLPSPWPRVLIYHGSGTLLKKNISTPVGENNFE